MARLLPAVVVASVLGLAAGAALARTSRRPADVIAAEIRAAKIPGGFLDDEGVRALEAACRRRTQLELELYESWPRDPRVAEALRERWALLENTFHEHATVLAETERVLAGVPRGKLARRALDARAWSSVHDEAVPVEECLRRVDAARRGGRDGELTAAALLELVVFRCSEPDLQLRLLERVADASGVPAVQRDEAHRLLRLAQRAGKPLDLGSVGAQAGVPAALERGQALLVYVRAESDWKPLARTELAALEARHRDRSVVALEIVLGQPWPEEWFRELGLVATPTFLVVDREGRLAGWSRALSPAEERLRALR